MEQITCKMVSKPLATEDSVLGCYREESIWLPDFEISRAGQNQ